MDEEKFLQMLALARAGIAPRERGEFCSVGYVSAVLEGANGKLYRGVNIDLACGLGAGVISANIADVCVGQDGALMSPCGACREFLALLAPENREAEFLTGAAPLRTVRLAQLLPADWREPPAPMEET